MMTPVTSYVVRKGCRGPNLALSNDDDGNVLIHARHRLIECRVPVNRINFPQRPTSSHECMSSMTISPVVSFNAHRVRRHIQLQTLVVSPQHILISQYNAFSRRVDVHAEILSPDLCHGRTGIVASRHGRTWPEVQTALKA